MIRLSRHLSAALMVSFVLLIPKVTQGQDSNLRPVSSKYAITNATIIQAPGKTISKGTVILENGVIKQVGSGISVPADAQVIKADSMFVYAGFISGMSNIGVPKPKEDNEKLDAKLKQNPPNDKAGITPGLSVVDKLSTKEKSIGEFRKLGFTAAITAPHNGMMSGRSALVLLGGSSAEGMVVKDNHSLNAQLKGASGMYPSTVIGVMAKFRDLYRKANQASSYSIRYASSNNGMERPVRDMTVEALFPVVNKSVPVSFKAEEILDIYRVLTLKKELGFNLQLTEVKQGWDAIDDIKSAGAGVFLSLDLPEMKEEKKKKDEDEDQSDAEEGTEEEEKEMTPAEVEKEALEKRKNESIKKHYAQASVFQKQGITFGFSTLEVKSKDFKKNLSAVIKNGLSEDQALAALTTSPARLLGVSSMMGSVETGKMANLIVTDKPYFDEKSNVRFVFVDGEMTKYEVKEKKKKKSGDSGEAVDPKGTWSYSSETPQGERTGTIVIKGTPGNYSGTMTLSFNESTNEMQDLEVDGSTVTFSINIEGGGRQMTMEISLEIDGDTFEGSMSMPFGSFPMEGTKEPELNR